MNGSRQRNTSRRRAETLGRIDLDPASHVLAQKTVRADTFFTAAEDGLNQSWFGRVWLNPPYNRALLSPFVDRLISEYARGAIEQAILLTHDYTDTEWFHAAARSITGNLPPAWPNTFSCAIRR